MLGNLNGWHLLLVIAVVLLLFGSTRLPGLAKSVGQSMKIFRSEVRTPGGAAAPPAAESPDDKPAA